MENLVGTIIIIVFGGIFYDLFKRWRSSILEIKKRPKQAKQEVQKGVDTSVGPLILWFFGLFMIYGILDAVYEWINGYAPDEWWEPLIVPFIPFMMLFGWMEENGKVIVMSIGVVVLIDFGMKILDLLRTIVRQLDAIRRNLDK